METTDVKTRYGSYSAQDAGDISDSNSVPCTSSLSGSEPEPEPEPEPESVYDLRGDDEPGRNISHNHGHTEIERKRSYHLPDDILHEIFFHRIRVTDAYFSVRTGVYRPIRKYHRTVVDVLLVCKQWYRIGHPHLCECLMFRDDKQVQSFYNMVMPYNEGETEEQKEKMTQLRTACRRLRLEGAIGPLFSSVLQLLDASRISSLFIDAVDDSREKVISPGTVATLENKDLVPRRVIIDWHPISNHDTCKIVNILHKRVFRWECQELVSNTCCYGYVYGILNIPLSSLFADTRTYTEGFGAPHTPNGFFSC